MSDVENLANIYECLNRNEDEVRVPAEKQLLEFRENNLIGFIQTNLDILKDPENFSPLSLHFSLLFTRIAFKKATKAKKTNDETKEYLFIPPELADTFIPVVFELLSTKDLCDFAAKLLGQISSYILCFDPENQVLSLICDELPNTDLSIPCCTAIEYLFQEIDVSSQLQSIILPIILPLLSNEDFPDEIKSKLITVITSMIISIPEFLPNPNELQEFAQLMLSLTSTGSLKKSSYIFWDNAATYLPSIFEFSTDIFEMSFNDLQSISDEENQEDSETLMIILQFWISLGKKVYKEPEGLESLLTPAIPALFPLFLTIYQDIPDPESLDTNESWDPHVAARDAIFSVSVALPEDSIPILLEFAEQAMENLESNPSDILKEAILYAFSTVIDAYEGETNEESENGAHIKNITSQCLQLVSQCLTEESDSTIRVVSQSLKLLLSIILFDPELDDFSIFTDFLMECMQNDTNPLCEDAKEILSEIVTLPAFNGELSTIFDNLLSFDNIPSLDCAMKIVKKENSEEFALQHLPQLIALAEIMIQNSEEEEQESVEIQESQALLPFVIQMIIQIIDELGEKAMPFCPKLFELMKESYTQFEQPETLKAICSIVHITNQNVLYAVNLVIIQLNNSISDEEADPNSLVESSYQMRLTAITSITFYLSKCDVSEHFHELMRILLKLLEIQQDQENEIDIYSELKIATLEAINSLHFSFPPLMKPFFERLIPIFEAALNIIPIIRDEEDGEKNSVEMNTAVLEGIKILLMNEADDSTVLQLALAAIQSAVTSPCMTNQCMMELLDILKEMLKLTPDETKNFISSNEELNELFEQAKEDPNLSPAVDSLLSLI